MKQIIRNSTFETNSSSMHSLVISKNARPYDSDDLKLHSFNDKEYELFGCCDRSTFERYPFEVLRTPKDKLRYYVAYYCGTKRDKNKIKEVKNLREQGKTQEEIVKELDISRSTAQRILKGEIWNEITKINKNK